MTVLSDLAETLVDRHIHQHRSPIMVLAHDTWVPQPGQSAVDILGRNTHIWDRDPTAGEKYLAELTEQGFLSTIIQLGVSNAIERALANRIPQGRYLRLVRGEHSDSYLEAALDFDEPRTKLLKIRGDITGRSAGHFGPKTAVTSGLRNSLKTMIRNSDLIWVGPVCSGADVDAILGAGAAIIWWVIAEPSGETARKLSSQHHLRMIEVDAAGYDSFLRDLALQTSRTALKPLDRESKRRLNDQVRSKLPVDVTYADQLIKKLAQQIRIICDEWRQRTLLVYIHDPAAPGGSEVERRINRYLKSLDNREPDKLLMTVKSARVRWIDRQALPLTLSHDKVNYDKIIIIDSISFTGRTLRLAAEHVRAEWPTADIYWAVLIAFKDLADMLGSSDIPSSHLIAAAETDRHDIFFPWGWTQATSPIVRHFDLYDHVQNVTIDQRPWGTVEVLTEQAPCSVRILSIRAGHRLSYHSHSARDELFVVVDGDVGFEFDSDVGGVVDAVLLSEGEYIAVPRGVRHRFAAYRDTARLLEIGFGLYDPVFDVERFSDDYGRVSSAGAPARPGPAAES